MISILVTANLEAWAPKALQQGLYIWYPIKFQKADQASDLQVGMNSGSEVNIITPAYVAKLGVKVG